MKGYLGIIVVWSLMDSIMVGSSIIAALKVGWFCLLTSQFYI